MGEKRVGLLTVSTTVDNWSCYKQNRVNTSEKFVSGMMRAWAFQRMSPLGFLLIDCLDKSCRRDVGG